MEYPGTYGDLLTIPGLDNQKSEEIINQLCKLFLQRNNMKYYINWNWIYDKENFTKENLEYINEPFSDEDLIYIWESQNKFSLENNLIY